MTTAKLNEYHVSHLLEERDTHLAELARIEKLKTTVNEQIMEALQAADVTRHQMMTGPRAGSIVYITAPSPRETVVPETLLSLGVAPATIVAATKYTPVKPYIRVDAPRATAEKGAPKGTEPSAAAATTLPEPAPTSDPVH